MGTWEAADMVDVNEAIAVPTHGFGSQVLDS
jgi:hypothetical protein